MKKCLLSLAAIAAIAPAALGVRVEIPSLDVGGKIVSRVDYPRIRITPGIPAQQYTVPSLQINESTNISRSVYSKIRVDAATESYTLLSADPSKSDITYTFNDAPKISVGTYSYTSPAVSGKFTLTSDNPSKNPDREFSFDDEPLIYLTTQVKDIPTSVEGVVSEGSQLISYHSATATLRPASGEAVLVHVYSLGGQKLLSGRVGGADGPLSVEALPAGVYIATASDTTDRSQTLKFIKRP